MQIIRQTIFSPRNDSIVKTISVRVVEIAVCVIVPIYRGVLIRCACKNKNVDHRRFVERSYDKTILLRHRVPFFTVVALLTSVARHSGLGRFVAHPIVIILESL